MKILASSDWHAAPYNLDRCEIALKQIKQLLKTHQPDVFLALGDLKDAMNPVDVRVSNFLIHAIQTIKKRCSVFVLRGNHDLITSRDGVPSCLPMLQSAGAYILRGNFPFRSLGLPLNIYAVPYYRNQKRTEQVLRFAEKEAAHDKQQDPKRFRLLVFHNEIDGCRKTLFIRGRGPKINPEPFHLCVGGHIHNQQRVGENIWYVGSIFPSDWGEANHTHGYLLIDTQKSPYIAPIPSVLPGWYDPTLPDFHPPASWKDAHVRVTIPIQLDPATEIQKARSKLEEKYPGAVLRIVPEFKSISGSEGGLKTQGSDEGWIREYLKQRKDNKYPPERTLAYLRYYLPPSKTLGVPPLHFKSVAARNVLCFEECALQLDRPGLTLVTGVNKEWQNSSNGSGKTSMFSLPLIALFGETPKGQKHDAWTRRGADGPATVQLETILDDQRVLTVERGRKPPLLKISIDGNDQSLGDANATQRFLESLTRLSWDVLTSSIYIGQQEISTVFGTEKQRKELFSRLLGLERFLDAQTALRKRLNLHQKLLTETEAGIEATEAHVLDLSVTIDSLQKELSELPPLPQTKEIQKEQKTLESQIENIKHDLTALEETLKINQERVETWLVKGTDNESRWKGLREQADKVGTVKGRCVVCGSVVSEAQTDKYLQELNTRIEALDAATTQYEQLQARNRKLRQGLINRAQKLQTALKTAQNRATELGNLQAQSQIRDHIDTLYQQTILKRSQTQRRKEDQEQLRLFILEQQGFIEDCIAVVGRDGLPAHLCTLITPQLNASVERFNQLLTEGGVTIRFEVEEGDIVVQIINLHGGEKSQDQSRGEMKMVGLIAALCFRDVLVPHNLLILDEPTEGLDSVNAARFARALNTLTQRFGTVFVTSHNPAILGSLEPDYHIEIVKENHIARVFEL